jgi:hypothetical protein
VRQATAFGVVEVKQAVALRMRERVKERLSGRVRMIECVQVKVFYPSIPHLAFIYKRKEL